MSLPLVAIVGAPNVGKSTLFNRLVGRRQALVTDEAGMTRDRVYAEIDLDPGRCRLVDTGGLIPRDRAPFAREIEHQATHALDEASLVLFVLDARAGVTGSDLEIAEMLRRRGQQVLPVANKIDGPSLEPLALELHSLRLGDPCAVSAEHGEGISELRDRIRERLALPANGARDESGADERVDETIRLALVGRPNVGKSSLLNRLAGEERVMVSEVPGTTRDAVDVRIRQEGQDYLLVDTAGIRRRGRVQRAPEVLSVLSAHKSISRADVVLLVIDASAGFVAQDAHIAGYAVKARKPLLVLVNKWDLIGEREQAARDWQREVREQLNFVRNVPMLLLSARSGQRVRRVLPEARRLFEEGARRISTGRLNRWLERIGRAERDSPARGRSINLLYATQTGIHPPRFVLFCNDPRRVHFSLRRFLENSLREEFDFGAAPIQLQFRRRTRSKT